MGLLLALVSTGLVIAWIRTGSRLTIGAKNESKLWRVIIRPAAVLFIPINEMAGRQFLLYLLGILYIIFLGMDLYRLFARKRFKGIYKRSESRRISSMTGFLLSMFIVFLLFSKDIAYLCLVFIIFGDLFAKLAGLTFGRIRIIHRRTVEGSMGFLAGSLLSGAIIAWIFGISMSILLAGVFIATLAEIFSFRVDDNFTVGILTGAGLTALEYIGLVS